MIHFILAGALHGIAVVTYWLTEYSLFGLVLALLTWGLLNFIALFVLGRPGISAVISLGIVGFIVVMSQFKFGVMWMTLTFLDIMVINGDTFAFLVQIFPVLKLWLIGGALLLIPAIVLIWWVDPFRVPRPAAFGGALVCVAAIVPLSIAVPEQAHEPFQGINHVSNFSRSGVYAVSQLLAKGWVDAADKVADPVPMKDDAQCRPERRLPNIIVILDESSFDASVAPGIKLPPDYADHFKSFDGESRSLLVESTGGPTWYSEYNLLTGLSARSYGKLMYYVTRIAAERVTRGLPQALARCGYITYSLYPAMGDFLSARRFQTGVGIQNFIDQHDMGAREEMQPDSFFYDQTLQLFARERSEAPLFVLTYLTANHFPWTEIYRSDLTPDWKAPGNKPEVDEYLRRQVMSARDYKAFVAKLKEEFPNEPFLIIRFGDHQPALSSRLLEPDAKASDIARSIMRYDDKFFTTHYVIDTINYTPTNLSSARSVLEGPYLALMIQDLAGVPLDPSFVEQKKILQRCAGKFFDCAAGAESRRFNRLLMDAGLIKDL